MFSGRLVAQHGPSGVIGYEHVWTHLGGDKVDTHTAETTHIVCVASE